MDVLSEILSSLRLTGGVVIDSELSGDFCLLSQFTPDHCAPFFPMPETLIGYHFVRSGQLIVEVEGAPPVTVGAGCVAILPRNDPHLLASRHGLPPADVKDIVWITGEGVHRVEAGTGGAAARLWCGFLGTAKNSAHPILDSLPPLLVLDVNGGRAEWLDSSMRFVAEQAPSPDVVARLAELFVVQAIREYVERLPPDTTGWLRGLRDPAVSRALSAIHTRYAEDLTIESLARDSGVSRTVLGERFSEVIGEPPMRYCARWRMRVAANLLRDGDRSSASIAYEVGFNSEAAFNRAFKREYVEPPATWRRRVEEEERNARDRARRRVLPPQKVQYCQAADGTRLAFSVVGDGLPLVKTANWLNHIEFDWESPIWKHWLAELTDGRALVRYDERGNGMSDWNTPELSFEAFLQDLETVVDATGLERFDLLGISQGAAISIAFAVRHPQRVRRMLLWGGFARGWANRGAADEIARREAMVTLTETGWGSDNPAFRQLFTNLYVPGATHRQVDWFNELQRRTASPENAAEIQRALSRIDVRDLLGQVTTPTLVMHARDDQVIPFYCAAELASGIRGARLVALEGKNHILLEDEPAWPEFVREMRGFLAADAQPEIIQPVPMPAA